MREKTKKRIIVGITGHFGAGKSTASSFFPKQWKIVNVDALGHKLLLRNTIKERILKQFGKKVFKNNKVNRKKLGFLVFADSRKRLLLNKIVHPALKKEIENEIKSTKRNIVLDCALLSELGLEKDVDYILLIRADETIKKQRLSTRFSEAEFQQRRNKQHLPRKPNIIILNNGSKQQLQKKVQKSLLLMKNGHSSKSIIFL